MTHHAPKLATVASNLRAINARYDQLLTQAVHKANDREIPGGQALVTLASVASPERYLWQLDYAERVLGEHPDVTHDDDDWEPPLQTLLFWSEAWRIEHNHELDGRRPTIATETNFLRWMLDWAWDNEIHFDDFATDVENALRRIEDTLKAGERTERTRVVCDRCEDKPPRLIKVWGATDHTSDRHKCPRCKHQFDHDALKRAHAKQLRSAGAEKFVPLREALATLIGEGRAERTARKWLEDGLVQARRDSVGRTEVWWPDVWRMHLSTPIRKRTA